MTDTLVDPWLLPQMERMIRQRPECLQTLLEGARSAFPELYRELALGAIEDGLLGEEAGRGALNLTSEELRLQRESYREAVDQEAVCRIIKNRFGIAMLRDSQVAVWEIVREFRRAGSVAELRLSYPGLAESDLRAALAYCGRHPDEVAEEIRAFEDRIGRALVQTHR